MDTNAIIYAMVSIGGLGIVFGAILGFASKIFAVDEDPRVGQVLECLPGANCGGCGYPGCGGLATAIVEGRAPVNACAVGGASAASAIAEVMGVVAEEKEPTVAFVKCGGTCDKAQNKYDYDGISDCVMAAQLAGKTSKACAYGCMGLGSCVKACQFGAIKIENGVAVVDPDVCVSCGNVYQHVLSISSNSFPRRRKSKYSALQRIWAKLLCQYVQLDVSDARSVKRHVSSMLSM